MNEEEGVNELILSPWLVEWEEAPRRDPDEDDFDWRDWDRDPETGEPIFADRDGPPIYFMSLTEFEAERLLARLDDEREGGRA